MAQCRAGLREITSALERAGPSSTAFLSFPDHPPCASPLFCQGCGGRSRDSFPQWSTPNPQAIFPGGCQMQGAGLKRRHLEGIFQSRLPALLPATQDWAGPPLTSPWRGRPEACCVSQSLPRFVRWLCRQALPPHLKDQRAQQRRSKTGKVSSGLAEVEGWSAQRWVSK